MQCEVLFVTCYLRRIVGLIIGIAIIIPLYYLLNKFIFNHGTRETTAIDVDVAAAAEAEAGADDVDTKKHIGYISFSLLSFFFFYLLSSILRLRIKHITFSTNITKRMFVIPQLIILIGVLFKNFIILKEPVHEDDINLLIKSLIIISFVSLGVGIMLGILTFSNILLDKYECKSFMNNADGLEQSFDCSPITPD